MAMPGGGPIPGRIGPMGGIPGFIGGGGPIPGLIIGGEFIGGPFGRRMALGGGWGRIFSWGAGWDPGSTLATRYLGSLLRICSWMKQITIDIIIISLKCNISTVMIISTIVHHTIYYGFQLGNGLTQT